MRDIWEFAAVQHLSTFSASVRVNSLTCLSYILVSVSVSLTFLVVAVLLFIFHFEHFLSPSYTHLLIKLALTSKNSVISTHLFVPNTLKSFRHGGSQ